MHIKMHVRNQTEITHTASCICQSTVSRWPVAACQSRSLVYADVLIIFNSSAADPLIHIPWVLTNTSYTVNVRTRKIFCLHKLHNCQNNYIIIMRHAYDV